MLSTVAYDSEKRALHVELPAKEGYEGLIRTTRDLASQLQVRQCAKLYVDARHIELDLTLMQTFHVVSAAVDHVPSGLHVAVAIRPTHRVMTEFASVAARQRGVVLEMFESPSDALGWLG